MRTVAIISSWLVVSSIHPAMAAELPPADAADVDAKQHAAQIAARLLALHKGNTPCLRYGSLVRLESAKRTEQAATRWRAAGLKSEQIRQVEPLFLDWALDAERSAHEAAPGAELDLALEKVPEEERASLLARPELADISDAIVRAVLARSGVGSSEAAAFLSATVAFDALSKPHQQAIQEALATSADVILSGSVLRRLEEQEASDRLTAAAETARRHFQEKGVWPEREVLEKLTGPLRDVKGEPLSYLRRDDGVALGSDPSSPLGYLRRRDGVALDSDRSWRCVSPKEVRAASSAALCEGVVRVQIRRAELKGLALGARLVPSFDRVTRQQHGVRVFSVSREGLFGRLRFESQDTVLSATIGTERRDVAETLAGLAAALQEAPKATFTLLRDETVIPLIVTVEDASTE